jgi:pyruvate dehydrogenase E2 component (dihydrolipoamide acetyltransferase)
MAVDVLLAKLGVEMESAILTEWVAEEGESVAAEQVVLTVETEKVSFEVAAPGAGLLHRVAEVGEEYEVGDLLAMIAADAAELAALGDAGGAAPAVAATEAPSAAAPAPPSAAAPAPPTTNGHDPGAGGRDEIAARRRGQPLASPLARRIAGERGVALAEVTASGPGGKILRRDVEAWLAAGVSPPKPAVRAEAAPAAATTVVQLGATRRTIARRMLASLQETAQMTDVREYDVSSLVELRRGLAARSETLGYKISFTDLFVRAAAISLRAVPELNATFADGELLHHPQANVGVAVAVPGGLVVPVVRGAGDCTLRELHDRMLALVERARERKVSAEDVAAGTFTVTNIGSYGSQFGTPVLNPPQVGILGTGAMQRKPVVRDDEIVVGTTMYLSLTVDHRVIDGEVAGRFLNVIGDLFAEPSLILVG